MNLLIFFLTAFVSFHAKAEEISYSLFEPQLKRSNTPMILAIHGCDQTKEEFRKTSNLDVIGTGAGYAVLFPNQLSSRNKLRCWNWFKRDTKEKNAIESGLILELVKKVQRTHPYLRGDVYVTGLSSGGALAGYLAHCYPNTFKGAAIHSAPSYLRVNNQQQALILMNKGRNSRLAAIHGCVASKRTPLLVVQGAKDRVVHPSNADWLIKDIAVRNKSYIIKVPDLEHAWSGGQPGKYSNTKTMKASMSIIYFFNSLRN